jgi:hypothetical protein
MSRLKIHGVEVESVGHGSGSTPIPAGTTTPALSIDDVSFPSPIDIAKRRIALRNFHAALANRDNATCKVWYMSDSTGEGTGTDTEIKRISNRLKYALMNRFPTSGLAANLQTDFVNASAINPAMPAPWALTGAWTLNQNYGPGGRALNINSVGAKLTRTDIATSITLCYARGASTGTLELKKDGVSQGTAVTTNASTLDGGATTFSSLGGASAVYDIVHNAGGSVYSEGAIIYNGDESKGIKVFDASHHGWTSTSAVTNHHGGTPVRLQSLITTFSPDLVILGFGLNDMTGNITTTTFKANLITLINDILAAKPLASIVILAEHLRTATGNEPWDGYIQVKYDVAALYTNCTVFDFSPRTNLVPQGGTDSYGFFADEVHQTALGQSQLASLLCEYLVPRSAL